MLNLISSFECFVFESLDGSTTIYFIFALHRHVFVTKRNDFMKLQLFSDRLSIHPTVVPPVFRDRPLMAKTPTATHNHSYGSCCQLRNVNCMQTAIVLTSGHFNSEYWVVEVYQVVVNLFALERERKRDKKS